MEVTKKISVIFIGSLLLAVSLNIFLIPANVFSSGFTGVAQLLATVLPLSTGVLLLLLNLPVAILGWFQIGKAFTLYSSLSVVLTMVFLEFIPIMKLSNDLVLNAVFGGVIMAVGVGMTLKFGASTGGLDIIALILSKRSDRPVGVYFLLINGLIVVTAGFLFDWERALYTLVSLYVTSRIIDTIHTRYVKLTAMVVTTKATELKQAVFERITRGVTVLPAKGGYAGDEKNILMIVVTRYEMYELKRIIQEIDQHAFTNIIETAEIYGFFRKDDEVKS